MTKTRKLINLLLKSCLCHFFCVTLQPNCVFYKMKTNQPLFSVLIANYNNGKYLMEAIESIDYE